MRRLVRPENIHESKTNCLCFARNKIQLFAPTRMHQKTSLGLDGPTFLASIGWDWVPGIRDRQIGIWQKVSLTSSGPVLVQNPFVTTDLALPKTDSADVTIEATVTNISDAPQTGVIPEIESKRLKEMGAWMAKMDDAFYGTRGGPWEPVDRQYGYCYKKSAVFVHLLKDYPGNTFAMPPLGKLRVKKVHDVYTGKSLTFEGESGITISSIDRTSSPTDSVIAVVYGGKIQRVLEN